MVEDEVEVVVVVVVVVENEVEGQNFSKVLSSGNPGLFGMQI